MSHARKKLAILVGGGPAPGINAVIGAATIRAVLSGFDVVGCYDGFSHLMKGDITRVRNLTIEDVSRIHFRGGSFLGIARANPTKREEDLEETIQSLLRLEVDKLVTIGGDDTCFSASQIERKSEGRLRVVHVPKTIDNDLDLPNHADTFGFQTARHIGVELTENLMVDARTTHRWYFIVAMGRKAGHIALGIGKAAGATITLIPEEFPEDQPIRLQHVVDILVGAIVKRMAAGRPDGVAILAEGIVERMEESDLEHLRGVERDAHGHIRLSEVPFGEILRDEVTKRLKPFAVKPTVVAKNIGYELRCADPIPFDLEYTRDLGYCAAKYLFSGGNAAMISMQGGHFVPVPFQEMLDPETGKTKIRMVDIHSTRYAIARRYMIRLRRDDFDDPAVLTKFGGVCNPKLSAEEFRRQFGYVVENEAPSLDLLHARDRTPAVR